MNLIVIAAHGLQCGWIGAYGNEWISTPHLDRLASEGIVFDRHYANVATPAGAVHAWTTGSRSPKCTTSLFSMLAAQSVLCVGLHDLCNSVVVPVAHDWDLRIETDSEIDLVSGTEFFLSGSDPDRAELLWIETDQLLPPWVVDPELFDAYSGTPDPESRDPVNGSAVPWLDPPNGFHVCDLPTWERLRHSYAAVIAAFDEQIGAICHAIRTAEREESTILIVTSGWGFPLGEHGHIGLGLPLPHEELVHLPLILRLPADTHAGKRISTFTQSIDILPTIAELLNIPLVAPEGRSILPLLNRNMKPIREYAFCQTGESSSIHTPDWAGMRSRSSQKEKVNQLYRKPGDRWEVNDVRQHHLNWAEYLETVLDKLELAVENDLITTPPRLATYDEIVHPPTTMDETKTGPNLPT